YDEPPGWNYPVRESHGAALLRASRAADAERVFRADLDRNPRNPRSLLGLAESLEAQGRKADAAFARAQFDLAARDADVPVRIEALGSPVGTRGRRRPLGQPGHRAAGAPRAPPPPAPLRVPGAVGHRGPPARAAGPHVRQPPRGRGPHAG